DPRRTTGDRASHFEAGTGSPARDPDAQARTAADDQRGKLDDRMPTVAVPFGRRFWGRGRRGARRPVDAGPLRESSLALARRLRGWGLLGTRAGLCRSAIGPGGRGGAPLGLALQVLDRRLQGRLVSTPCDRAGERDSDFEPELVGRPGAPLAEV